MPTKKARIQEPSSDEDDDLQAFIVKAKQSKQQTPNTSVLSELEADSSRKPSVNTPKSGGLRFDKALNSAKTSLAKFSNGRVHPISNVSRNSTPNSAPPKSTLKRNSDEMNNGTDPPPRKHLKFEDTVRRRISQESSDEVLDSVMNNSSISVSHIPNSTVVKDVDEDISTPRRFRSNKDVENVQKPSPILGAHKKTPLSKYARVVDSVNHSTPSSSSGPRGGNVSLSSTSFYASPAVAGPSRAQQQNNVNVLSRKSISNARGVYQYSVLTFIIRLIDLLLLGPHIEDMMGL